MNRLLQILLIAFSLLSCVKNKSTLSLSSMTDNLQLEEDSTIIICYPDRKIELVLEDEREIYFVRDLFGKETVSRMKGVVMKRMELDDPLIRRRVVDLVDGLGYEGKDEGMHIVEPDLALIIQYGKERADTVGLSATDATYAVDSSLRGVLYPCPELMDIVVNYIAERDSLWAQKQINFERQPNYDWEWLQMDSHSFCENWPNKGNLRSNPDKLTVTIQYAKNYTQDKRQDKDLLSRYDHRSDIRCFLRYTGQEQVQYELTIDNKLLTERIITLLDLDGMLTPDDNRFKKTMMFSLLIDDSVSVDTVGIGGWPLDRIQLSGKGDLYPNAELFRIVINYVVQNDPEWLNSIRDSRVYPFWDLLQMKEGTGSGLMCYPPEG